MVRRRIKWQQSKQAIKNNIKFSLLNHSMPIENIDYIAVNKYFTERGFDIIEDSPPEGAEYPYFILQGTQENPVKSGPIELRYGEGQNVHVFDLGKGMSSEKFISLVSELARQYLETLDIPEPTEGKIPVYVTKDCWLQFTDELLKEFNA